MDSQDTTPQEKRRCIELNLAGHPCGNTPVAGRERCYIHGIYHALNDGRSTIDIPLLEDPRAILYVYSQVARALAQGAMPPANANGIIRCCKGAQRLLEEQWKRERFEERRRKAEGRSRKTEDRNGESENADAAADPLAKDQPDQTDATVPPNLKNSDQAADTEATMMNSAPDNLDAINEASDGCPRSPLVGDMGAAASADEPQPWNVERPLPVVPPPQFADAPEKFKYAVERVGSQHLDALLRRDRAIRARGGSMSDFYEKRGQGVRCDIRDAYPMRRHSS